MTRMNRLVLVAVLLTPLATLHAAESARPSWALIQPGVFQMGAQPGPQVLSTGADRTYAGPDWDESPVHEVRISRPYSLSVAKVTQGEFARFRPEHQRLITSRGLKWEPEAPAIMVTWGDAVAYCRWRSAQEGEPVRLPTEAEWEFAARQAESLGLQGMSDGLLEWCQDWWGPYAAGAVTDPLGPERGEIRVIRGRDGERTETLLVAGKKVRHTVKPSPSDRSGTVPEDRRLNIGFRIVKAPLPQGTFRPPLPAAEVFSNISQQRMDWKKPANPEIPVFHGATLFIDKPAGPLALPYFGRHHVPSIAACDNGDLLVTAMTAPADSSDQMAILLTRLRQGAEHWDPPARFFVAPDRDIDSAVLFDAGNGELQHYNSLGGAQHHFSVVKRVSTDNGATWSPARLVHEYPANPESPQKYTGVPRFWTHLSIVRLPDGTIVMPSDAGYSGINDDGTVLWSSRDLGESWSEMTRYGWNAGEFAKAGGQAGWIAGIHAPFVVLEGGRLLAIGRGSAIGDRAPLSLSSDQGKTWTCQASPFPWILNSQRATMLRLSEGPILFVSYTDASPLFKAKTPRGMDFTDDAGGVHHAAGMFAALSLDEGRSWTHRKLIPLDAKQPFKSDAGGYLACVQTPDGLIHMVSSRRYYSFNLAWLKNPAPAKP